MKISWTVLKLQREHKITIVKFQKGITSKMYWQELWFLSSARCLIMLYISMNNFQIIEQT